MLIKSIMDGRVHFVAQEFPFGIDTICGIDIPMDQYVQVEGGYPECNCIPCRIEIQKDLKRKGKIKKPDRKTESFKI